jgi:hypothetical protein
MEELLKQLLAAQQKTNDLLLAMSEGETVQAGQYSIKKLGEINVNVAGFNKETPFDIPQELEDISFFFVETNNKDLLLKRASIGLSIDGYSYFDKDIPAKTFYFPEYNDQRMLDLREYSADGKAIVSKSKEIKINVIDDVTVNNPAFAAYKISCFVRGINSNTKK